MLDISAAINKKEMARLIKSFSISDKSAQTAARRAINKTAKYVESQAARAISTQLKVQNKLIRKRLRIYNQNKGLERLVWLGLNSISASALGKPRRRGSGTQVGRHFFDGAFPIERYGGGIYRRVGKERFPLTLQKIQIDDVGALAMEQAAKAAEQRFLVLLRQELNYEFSKLLKTVR